MEPILEVSNLKKHFTIKGNRLFEKKTVYAVDGVSLSIAEGETLGLVGESGSGKTTVGRCILRLIEPTSGQIFFKKKDLTKLSVNMMDKERHQMQIIFQDPFGSLTPRKKIFTLLKEPLDIHKIGNPKNRRSMVADTMRQVGLRPEHMDRFPHEFSGGQRQRICIARAIIARPKFIVADEPVSALDVSIRAQVLNLMADLQSKLGLSYLFITHDLSVVKYMCDRIAVMYLGKIIEIASGMGFNEDIHHPYTEALLSAIPIPVARRRRKRIVLKGDVPSPINPPMGCVFHPRCCHGQKKCEQVVPELKLHDNGHFIACHFR